MSSVRTSRAPCDFCGGFDQYEGINRRTRKPETQNMLNYTYPDQLLPGTEADVNKRAEKEYEES
jgi:hypothetical protein